VPSARGAVTPAATAPAALASVACRSVNDCMAVGSNTPTMSTQLAAEQWNGRKWTRLTMLKPAGVVNAGAGGVACPAARECVAVGWAFPADRSPYALAGYWNGARWTTGRAGAPGGTSAELFAISCPAVASCYAVGYYTPKGQFTALIEHWNGNSWTRQATPQPHGTTLGELFSVSCRKTSFCVAVGTDGNGVLIERWNGKTWTDAAPATPAAADLWGVSCATTTMCFAVGGTGGGGNSTLAERWNGKTWSKSPVPAQGGAASPFLQSVSCVSATRCLAVADELTARVFADVWNGKSWKLAVVSASGPHLGDFEQVQCLSATSCVALGSVSPIDAAWRSVSAFWNGKTWKVIPTV